MEVLRDVALPDELAVVRSVVDTKTNVVEHPELVAQRIERLAAAIGRERLVAATDCAFGTSSGFRPSIRTSCG